MVNPINKLQTDLDYIIDNTRELWEELRGKKIFITGGTGFFGCWLLESLIWANKRLNLNSHATILTRNIEAFKTKVPHLAGDPCVDLRHGDVVNFNFWNEHYPFIIHAASDSNAYQDGVNLLSIFDTIVNGTRRVLEFAKHTKAEKFLLASSGAVYGKHPVDLSQLSESFYGGPDTLNHKSMYAEGKRVAEMLCAVYAQLFGFQIKIARGFAFVGPYLPLNAQFAIGNFIRDGLTGGPIVVNSDGSALRSYLYAADMTIWLWKILFKGTPGSAYNIGSANAFSIEETARCVSSCFGNEVKVEIRKKRDPRMATERYIPCVDKARIELDLPEGIDLPESINRTIQWHSL